MNLLAVAWREIPPGYRVALLAVAGLIGLPIVLRVYAAWWAFVTSGSLCDTFAPRVP